MSRPLCHRNNITELGIIVMSCKLNIIYYLIVMRDDIMLQSRPVICFATVPRRCCRKSSVLLDGAQEWLV